MDASAHADLAALVAAWHNRHPLSRRITPAQVQGEGLVVLPYLPTGRAAVQRAAPAPEPTTAPTADAVPSAPAGKGLRARAASAWQAFRQRLAQATAAWRRPSLRAAFDEDFIAPLRPARIARFALRQGSETRPGPPDWPQRQVALVGGHTEAPIERRYLRTAAIEVGKTRLRVLVGAGPRAQVLGPRLWSRPRCGAAAGVLAVLLLGGGVTATRLSGSEAPALAAASPAASASGRLQEASAPASAAASATVLAHAGTASAVASTGAHEATAAAAPPVVATTASASAAQAGHGPDPAASAASAPRGAASAAVRMADAASAGAPQRIRPELSPEVRQAARQEAEALRATRSAEGAASAASGGDGKVYAVATPETRTRAGAQLRIVLMAAPTEAEPGRPRAEVMQVGKGWRAVIWPFNDRASADRTRDQLASRGIPAEVIDF